MSSKKFLDDMQKMVKGYAEEIEDACEKGWFDLDRDILGIEYNIGISGSINGVRIMLTCGGPNVYVDTAKRRVEMYWSSYYTFYPISDNASSVIQDTICCYYR